MRFNKALSKSLALFAQGIFLAGGLFATSTVAAQEPAVSFGQLLSAKPLAQSASIDVYPDASDTFLVAYISRDEQDRAVPMIGQVVLPEGNAPSKVIRLWCLRLALQV